MTHQSDVFSRIFSERVPTVFARFLRVLLMLTMGMWLAGCQTAPPTDYAVYRQHLPKSILVLPPLNETVEPLAPYAYISTLTAPLAEAGYYVYPVAVVDAFLKENGLPTPVEMQGISLKKIKEIIGADAVLYVTLHDYGQQYTVLASNTRVRADARLVDVASGALLWQGQAFAQQSSGDGGGGLAGQLIAAMVTQIIDDSMDKSHQLSAMANRTMIFGANGLLVGPRHPSTTEDLRGR